MSDTRPILPRSEIETSRANAAQAQTARAGAVPGGVAFQALIEKLETQAAELESETRRVNSPDELAGAVDRAQASLHGALELSSRLLEAYRASRQQTDAAPADDRP
jgi:hypothetical protein